MTEEKVLTKTHWAKAGKTSAKKNTNCSSGQSFQHWAIKSLPTPNFFSG